MMYCLNNILIEVSFTIGSKRCLIIEFLVEYTLFVINLVLYLDILPLELSLTLNIHLQLTTFRFGSKVVKFQV
jgi:hypothetical protein